MVREVKVAAPRGFCAGVVRAVEIVELALEAYGQPVYVLREIVHNAFVVEDLRKKGAVFVGRLADVPEGSVMIFSAHGVSPDDWDAARRRHLEVIDATCPLVTKVHLEAIKYARQDYTILVIGHAGHEEVIGTMGEAPRHTRLVTTVQDAQTIPVENPEKIAYLTQTTLSLDDTRAVIEALKARFPSIQGPPSEDICYATQNRQTAVKKLAAESDAILVIGSANSSNSNRLVEEATKAGCSAYLIDSVDSIRPEWLEGVEVLGLTSGASAPEVLVGQVLEHFKGKGAQVDELVTGQENVHFALPPQLVQVQ